MIVLRLFDEVIRLAARVWCAHLSCQRLSSNIQKLNVSGSGRIERYSRIVYCDGETTAKPKTLASPSTTGKIQVLLMSCEGIW
jgi:hypothetical protein